MKVVFKDTGENVGELLPGDCFYLRGNLYMRLHVDDTIFRRESGLVPVVTLDNGIASFLRSDRLVTKANYMVVPYEVVNEEN